MVKKRKEEIERQLKDNQEMHDTLIMQCQKQGESQHALMVSQNNQLLEEIEILNATNQNQQNELHKLQEAVRVLEQNVSH